MHARIEVDGTALPVEEGKLIADSTSSLPKQEHKTNSRPLTFAHEVHAGIEVDGTALPVEEGQLIADSAGPVQFLPHLERMHLLQHLHRVDAALETLAKDPLQLKQTS